MTHDEGQELLNVLMDATSRVVNSRLSEVAKVISGSVRFVSGGSVYVRQSTDMSTPRVASPASVADLDDGDVLLPNISGQSLVAGDDVEVMFTRSIADGVITRKLGADTGRELYISNNYVRAHFAAVGNVKTVVFTDFKNLPTGTITTIIPAADMADYIPTIPLGCDFVAMSSALERIRLYIDTLGVRAYNYSSNTGTINSFQTVTYV